MNASSSNKPHGLGVLKSGDGQQLYFSVHVCAQRPRKKWCHVLVCFLQEEKEPQRRDGWEVDWVTYKKGGFFIFAWQVSGLRSHFPSHHFTLHKHPLQQMWLTKPLKQLGTLQTREAGGGFLHLPSTQHSSSRQLTALSCHQLHIIIPQQAAIPPAQKVGSARPFCLATCSGMALPCTAKQAWALPSVWCCW